jgi:hypothetical protein
MPCGALRRLAVPRGALRCFVFSYNKVALLVAAAAVLDADSESIAGASSDVAARSQHAALFDKKPSMAKPRWFPALGMLEI